jgi:hypothetical protein
MSNKLFEANQFLSHFKSEVKSEWYIILIFIDAHYNISIHICHVLGESTLQGGQLR